MSLLASLLYGSQYVVIKTGMGAIDPLLFGTLTTGTGGILALTYLHFRRGVRWAIFRRWEIWAGGMTTVAMISLQYTGLTLTTASLGGLIVGSNIIFVAPLSALVFKEALGWKRATGVALGLLGLFTISTDWDLSTVTSGELLGNVLLLGASLAIALSYPLTRLATRNMSFDEWVTGFHLLAPLPLAALALLDGEGGSAAQTNALAVLFVGGLCTALPTMLWAKGLESITFVTSATILLSESAFAVFLGSVFLGEPITLFTIGGAVLIFTAIFLASWKNGKREAKEKSGF